MSILVTCASSSLGRDVVKSLSEKDFHVKAGLRNTKKASSFNWSNVQVCEFDFANKSLFESALINVDTLILISPPTSLDVDKLVKPFIYKAIQNGIQKIINISAMGVEFDPKTPMRKIEKYIKKFDIDYIFIRPTWFMQNFNTRFCNMIKFKDMIIAPAGNSVISFIDTRDIADLILKLLSQKELKQIEYTLTGPQSLTVHEISEIISKQINRQVNYVNVSDDVFFQLLIDSGLKKETAEYQSRVFEFIRQGRYSAVSPNILINLGRVPRNFTDYVADFAQYWINE